MPHKTLEARRAYARQWALEHPGYGTASSRKRRELHPEAAREEYLKHKSGYVARAKAWQERNPDKAKESKRKALRKAHEDKPEYFKQKHKEWIARHPEWEREYYERYKPRRRIVKSAWRANNKDKVSAQIRRRTLSGKTAEQDHRRRARIRSVGCEDCSAKVLALRRERFCRWCCIALTPKNFTVDHIVPLSRGGHHKPDNLAAACRSCNLSKGNKLVHEWTWEAA